MFWVYFMNPLHSCRFFSSILIRLNFISVFHSAFFCIFVVYFLTIYLPHTSFSKKLPLSTKFLSCSYFFLGICQPIPLILYSLHDHSYDHSYWSFILFLFFLLFFQVYTYYYSFFFILSLRVVHGMNVMFITVALFTVCWDTVTLALSHNIVLEIDCFDPYLP